MRYPLASGVWDRLDYMVRIWEKDFLRSSSEPSGFSGLGTISYVDVDHMIIDHVVKMLLRVEHEMMQKGQ